MTTYSSVFGGQTVPPSEYKYRAIPLTANVTLAWPDNTDGTDLVAALMDVTPSGGTWTITLPPANEVSSGRDFLMRNLGAVAFNVVDNASGALATIAAGESRYFYITSNSTAAGSWSVFTYGTGTSSADASALDGYGLTVLSGTLNADLPISGIGATYTISATDRAQFLVYQGGTGTWYWPDPTTLPNGFFCAINNAGTGTLTIDANTAGGYIDEANTKTIQPGESCLIVNKGDATGCFTVGYGRATEFAFTQLSVDVTGTGGITITSAQAANKLWYFYNTAGGDRTVTIPAVASVYFVRVGAIGAGNELTFTTGAGSTVALSANQSYTIYCDGTNVVSAQTVAVTSTVSLDDGTAATPSISFSLDTDTGLYRAGTNELGITANGAMVATFGTAGLTLATPLSVANGGTGRATSTTAYGLIAAGTTATGAHQTLPAGATTEILVGGGASALPAWTTATGSGAPVRANTPTLVTPILGTPTSGTLTNCTGLPVSSISGLGAGVADFLATPSSANLATAVTDETGSGALVFANAPTLVAPVLGTPTSGTLTNCTGLPLSTGVTGALAIGNGGTGQTTATAAFDALAPTTTKGDLIAHDGTDNVRVGVGTNGYVLAADSTATPGVAWKSAGSLGVLTLPVSVANGGTAATDAATARANLGAGDVNGPASATDGNYALFDGVTGKLVKNGGAPSAKQDALVSGTNIKTINGASLLGAGDMTVGGLSVSLSGTTTVYVTQEITYTITNYNAFSAYSVGATLGSASIAGDTITYTAPGASGSETLTVTVDGAAVEFALTILPAGVATPTNTSPSNGATNQNGSVTLTASAFSWVGLEDTHASSDWQVATDSGFSNIVIDNSADAVNLESYTATGLDESQTYYWRVRYTGAANGTSSWSSAFSFVTKDTFGGLIGTQGGQGFGVGEYPTTLPSGFSAMTGTSDPASANYGNYQYSDGSIMVFVPRFYYRIGNAASPRYATYGANAIDIVGVDTYATEAAANTAGYAMHRAFKDGGADKSGFFIDKYLASKNGATSCKSVALGVPISLTTTATYTNSNGMTTGEGTCTGILADAVLLARSRGVGTFNVASVFMYSALALLALAHAQASSNTTYCAWYDATNNFPKGCNNGSLADTNDAAVTFTTAGDSGSSAKPLTGSASSLAKTTHNGQACGVADVNGAMHQAALGVTNPGTSGTDTTQQSNGDAYVLKASVALASLTSGWTSGASGTDAWGDAAHLGLLYDSTTGLLPWGSTTGWTYFGNGANQVFSGATSGTDWLQTACGIQDTTSGTSAGGTALFGADGCYQYNRANLFPRCAGSWIDAAPAGVFYRNWDSVRSAGSYYFGFRAGAYGN